MELWQAPQPAESDLAPWRRAEEGATGLAVGEPGRPEGGGHGRGPVLTGHGVASRGISRKRPQIGQKFGICSPYPIWRAQCNPAIFRGLHGADRPGDVAPNPSGPPARPHQ